MFDFDPHDPENPDDDVDTERPIMAYVYDGAGGYRILQNPAPGTLLRPIHIDEEGTVFGWAGEPLVATNSSYPTAQRNELGQIVAVSLDRGLLFYDPIANTWADITASIDGLEAGTSFSTIQGFNDEGQFVGLARQPRGGGSFGYMISPVPEPTAFAPLGVAVSLALGTNTRRQRVNRG